MRVPGQADAHIVIAVDFEGRDDQAMAFMLGTLWKPGTVVDLVHVVLAQEEHNEVYHAAAPGSSLDARDPESAKLEDAAITQARAAVQKQYAPQLDERGITHNLHLFLDTVNAPARAIFDSINSVCSKVDAQMLVMAANKRVRILRYVRDVGFKLAVASRR